MIGNTSLGVGSTQGSASYDHLGFVGFRHKDCPEMDRPDSVFGFFQADVMLSALAMKTSVCLSRNVPAL